MTSTSATEIGWLAGLLEGEGSFGWTPAGKKSKKRYPKIELSMTDEDTVRRVASISRMGNVYGPYEKAAPRKPVWRWSVTKQADAASLMMTMYPLMSGRRQERIREILLEWRQNA